MHSMRHILTAAALLSSCSRSRSARRTIVDNFRLTDQQGTSHELYYLSDMKAVVLLAQGTGCDASQKAAATIAGLRAKYEPQGVTFLLLDSNLQDAGSREALAAKATQAGIGLPILMDETQLVGEALGITRNGEVLIANPQGWKIAYRGGVGAVPAALDSMIAGGAVKAAASEVAGCAIKMPAARHAASARADLLRKDDRADADRQVRRLSPHRRHRPVADDQLRHDQRLRADDPRSRAHAAHAADGTPTRTTVRSATIARLSTDAGARRSCTGSKPARRAAPALIRCSTQKKDWPQWPLGKPDLIVELPSFTVPATGTIPYQMTKVENPLDHDVWVRAIDLGAGRAHRRASHHRFAAGGAERRGSGEPQQLRAWRRTAASCRPEAGILLPAHATFHFQTHYTSNGKQLTDTTRMGLYFRKDAPKYNFRSLVFANPQAAAFRRTRSGTKRSPSNTLKEDAILYSAAPACALSRQGVALRRVLPGRQGTRRC